MCTLSSCLQNEEPAGVENLRNAKSELIKAEAQYKAAEIALVQAEAALKETIRAGYELDNKLKELDVQLKEAQVAYELARIELQKAQDAAANEVELAKLQNDLLAQEIRKQKLENQKELVVEEHKEALLKAQKAVAEAEKAYQDVLDEINSVTTELTQAEKDQLSYYTQQVEAIRTKLNTAQTDLVGAQHELIKAKYEYDPVQREVELTRKVAAANETLENVKTLLAEAEEIDLQGGVSEWITRKEGIDAKKEEIETQKKEIDLATEEKRQEAAPLEEELVEVKKSLDEVEADIAEVRDGRAAVYNDPADEETVTIPDIVWGELWFNNYWFDGALAFFKSSYGFDIQYSMTDTSPYSFTWTAPRAVSENWGEIKEQKIENLDQIFFLGTLIGLPQFVDQYYDGGKPGWDMRNSIRNSGTPWSAINDYILTESQLNSINEQVDWKKAEFETAKAEYDAKVKLYSDSKDSFLGLLEDYGIVYNPVSRLYRYEEVNYYSTMSTAFENLSEAYDKYLTDGTAVPANVSNAFLTAFRTEQAAREQMFGKDAIWTEGALTYKDFTSEKWANSTVTFDIASSAFYTIGQYDILSGYREWNITTNYFVYSTDLTKVSVAQQWFQTSVDLYGLEWLREPIAEELKDQIQVSVVANYGTVSPWYTIEESSDVYKVLSGLYGVSGSQNVYEAVRGTEWFSIFDAEKNIEVPEDVVAAQDAYKAIAADLTELYDKYVALADEKAEAAAEYDKEELDLLKKWDEIDTQKDEITANIDAINAEADVLGDYSVEWSQVSVLQRSWTDLDNLSDLLEQLIEDNAAQVTIPAYGEYNGYTGAPGEMLEEEYEKYIEALNKGVETAEDEVRKAERNLEYFKEGDDNDDKAKAVEEAEVKLEQAQEEYDYLLEQFNFYNDLLKELMAAIIGGEELPETPETPAA